MIKKATIFLVLTALVGSGFVFGADYWMNSKQPAPVAAIVKMVNPEIVLKKVVVAREPLGFGTVLTSENLDEISWPQNAMPPGVFHSIEEMLKEGSRVVLRPIEPNEPILTSKITGSNENASLSRIIEKGNRAVTVRVNDVAGVAGFIQPGDRVDVVVTREVSIPGRADQNKGRAKRSTVADLLLQGVRVLTIDQFADERSEGPQVAKAVTLELNSYDAQKIALASSVGDLSLLLRSAGDQSRDISRTLDLSELVEKRKPEFITIETSAMATANVAPVVSSVSLIVIRRPKNREEYKVPIDSN